VANHKESSRTYQWLHATLGRLIRWYFRMEVKGLENVPDGPAIFVAPHKAVIDSYVIVAALPAKRSVKFLAKAEYFEDGDWKQRLLRWLVRQAAIPVDRDDKASGKAALESIEAELWSGGSFALHPEGTRVPDERIYKAKPGFVYVAWATGVPVVPVLLRGTEIANEPDSRHLRRHKVEVEFLEPIENLGPTAALRAVEKFGTDNQVARLHRRVVESQAREIMELFARKLGVRYVDKDIRRRDRY
jgi:1-acyl-sn-glycerol-3-phosphate acyltransferase